MPNTEKQERLLVIKLSALGDFIQALGPMKAIRDHHPNAHITLLTTAPYVELGKACGYFDAIWQDIRPKPWQVRRTLRLKQQLKSGHFDKVYDLQTSDRSSSYFKLMGGKVKWSGIAKGCSHPHLNPKRNFMHTIERQREQLEMAGIYKTPLSDLSWANSDVSHFNLPSDFALVVPGGSAHRPDKRWTTQGFRDACTFLLEKGITPVLIGTLQEADILAEISKNVPNAIDLSSKTSFLELCTLARMAKIALGNDTGPMHLFALSNCPSLVLYSHASDPELCGQRGEKVEILRTDSLQNLAAETVFEAMDKLL